MSEDPTSTDDYDAGRDARMIELGMEPGAPRPGDDLYDGRPPEHHEQAAIEVLGVMPDGATFRHPRIAEAAHEVAHAERNLGFYQDAYRDEPDADSSYWLRQARDELEQATRAFAVAEATYDDDQFIADERERQARMRELEALEAEQELE